VAAKQRRPLLAVATVTTRELPCRVASAQSFEPPQHKLQDQTASRHLTTAPSITHRTHTHRLSTYSTCHGRAEVVAGDRVAVVPLEVQLHAALEALLPQQRAVQADDFGALLVHRAGVCTDEFRSSARVRATAIMYSSVRHSTNITYVSAIPQPHPQWNCCDTLSNADASQEHTHTYLPASATSGMPQPKTYHTTHCTRTASTTTARAQHSGRTEVVHGDVALGPDGVRQGTRVLCELPGHTEENKYCYKASIYRLARAARQKYQPQYRQHSPKITHRRTASNNWAYCTTKLRVRKFLTPGTEDHEVPLTTNATQTHRAAVHVNTIRLICCTWSAARARLQCASRRGWSGPT
jgi:hypothetical protein